jgi:hypothetical protein
MTTTTFHITRRDEHGRILIRTQRVDSNGHINRTWEPLTAETLKAAQSYPTFRWANRRRFSLAAELQDGTVETVSASRATELCAAR